MCVTTPPITKTIFIDYQTRQDGFEGHTTQSKIYSWKTKRKIISMTNSKDYLNMDCATKVSGITLNLNRFSRKILLLKSKEEIVNNWFSVLTKWNGWYFKLTVQSGRKTFSHLRSHLLLIVRILFNGWDESYKIPWTSQHNIRDHYMGKENYLVTIRWNYWWFLFVLWECFWPWE